MINGVLAVVVWFVTLMAGGTLGCWVGFGLGLDHAAEEDARLDRHTHRKGDPAPGVLLELPRAGRLEPLPEPPLFLFPGEPVRGWAAESAEYELLTRTAVQPAVGSLDWCAERLAEVRADERAERVAAGERPIDTGEIMAITDRVEAWIAGWDAQGNYDRHTIQAGEG